FSAPIDCKAPNSDIMVIRVFFFNHWLPVCPVCITYKLNCGIGISCQSCTVADQDSIINYVCERTLDIDSRIFWIVCNKLKCLVDRYLITCSITIKITTAISCNIDYWCMCRAQNGMNRRKYKEA